LTIVSTEEDVQNGAYAGSHYRPAREERPKPRSDQTKVRNEDGKLEGSDAGGRSKGLAQIRPPDDGQYDDGQSGADDSEGCDSKATRGGAGARKLSIKGYISRRPSRA
jgi:hypothetical protein